MDWLDANPLDHEHCTVSEIMSFSHLDLQLIPSPLASVTQYNLLLKEPIWNLFGVDNRLELLHHFFDRFLLRKVAIQQTKSRFVFCFVFSTEAIRAMGDGWTLSPCFFTGWCISVIRAGWYNWSVKRRTQFVRLRSKFVWWSLWTCRLKFEADLGAFFKFKTTILKVSIINYVICLFQLSPAARFLCMVLTWTARIRAAWRPGPSRTTSHNFLTWLHRAALESDYTSRSTCSITSGSKILTNYRWPCKALPFTSGFHSGGASGGTGALAGSFSHHFNHHSPSLQAVKELKRLLFHIWPGPSGRPCWWPSRKTS